VGGGVVVGGGVGVGVGGGASILQCHEHPSPSTVLPSSHSSPESLTPLPHLRLPARERVTVADASPQQ